MATLTNWCKRCTSYMKNLSTLAKMSISFFISFLFLGVMIFSATTPFLLFLYTCAYLASFTTAAFFLNLHSIEQQYAVLNKMNGNTVGATMANLFDMRPGREDESSN